MSHGVTFHLVHHYLSKYPFMDSGLKLGLIIKKNPRRIRFEVSTSFGLVVKVTTNTNNHNSDMTKHILLITSIVLPYLPETY